MPSYSDSGDTSDEGDGSTDYYTDPPDSPVEAELSPSPTPVGPLGRNHSYEGHSDSEGGPSSQSSQSTQRPRVQPSDEDEDKRTPRKRPNVRNGDGIPESANKGSDDELDALRLEIQTTLSVSTPPRLRPDPYAGWSPTKRKIMVLLQSRTPGEVVDIKRSIGEGVPRIEMR